MVNDVDRQRYGNYLYGAFGRDFETKDGKRVMVVGLTASSVELPLSCDRTGGRIRCHRSAAEPEHG